MSCGEDIQIKDLQKRGSDKLLERDKYMKKSSWEILKKKAARAGCARDIRLETSKEFPRIKLQQNHQ